MYQLKLSITDIQLYYLSLLGHSRHFEMDTIYFKITRNTHYSFVALECLTRKFI